MKCPYCAFLESKVVDSRPADEGASIRRRRECLSCHKRFTTYETVESLPLMVMARLKKLDEVAYVRFASVYRQFKDINTFMTELNKLLEDK